MIFPEQTTGAYNYLNFSSLCVGNTILYIGLKRIYRIFEYSFEMIEQIFVRFETNVRLNEY